MHDMDVVKSEMGLGQGLRFRARASDICRPLRPSKQNAIWRMIPQGYTTVNLKAQALNPKGTADLGTLGFGPICLCRSWPRSSAACPRAKGNC